MTIFDWCRHCGNHGPMTEEHLPPRVAGNQSPITVYNEQEGALTVLRSFKAGHTIPSLCRADNNKASHRGLPEAYALWRDDTIGHLREAAAAFHHDSGQPHNDLFFIAAREGGAFKLPMEHGTKLRSEHITNLNPGKIVRQALGMMLAVQDTRYLLDTSQLAAAYHSDEPTSIEPFALHLALANPGLCYFRNGVLSVSVNLTGAGVSSTEFWGVAFPPFLILLTSGPKAPIEATRIDRWLEYPVSRAFSKRDRKVRYPIADPRELLVAKLYQDQQRLKEMGG
ncbi:hypothetical protein OG554_05075 [Streptomyces griseus]|uniref:hypothetical protein n=1 Tax=Streptomyces griseus TaxID=1911 RepID=UPI0038632139|nr:hypothetical protein OG554_05075 [Streptomyces fimicarius]